VVGLIVSVEPAKLTWLASVIAMVATALPSAALWMTHSRTCLHTLVERENDICAHRDIDGMSAGVVPDKVGGVVSGGTVVKSKSVLADRPA